jgi:hypothetical protein
VGDAQFAHNHRGKQDDEQHQEEDPRGISHWQGDMQVSQFHNIGLFDVNILNYRQK